MRPLYHRPLLYFYYYWSKYVRFLSVYVFFCLSWQIPNDFPLIIFIIFSFSAYSPQRLCLRELLCIFSSLFCYLDFETTLTGYCNKEMLCRFQTLNEEIFSFHYASWPSCTKNYLNALNSKSGLMFWQLKQKDFSGLV